MTDSSLQSPPALHAFANGKPVALFLDFDGTLVDIAPTPDAISVPDDMAVRLVALAERMEGRFALVSGRSIEDLERYLGALRIARAGSHGSDCRTAGGTILGEAAKGLPDAALRAVDDFAAEHGFSNEAKPHGAALHFRSDPSLEDAGLQFARKLADAHGLIVKQGKCVIELVASGADKASAVRAFMQSEPFAGSVPIFVGDDVTDEDGMHAARELGGCGVAVGERPSENATYALASPAAVHHWLQL